MSYLNEKMEFIKQANKFGDSAFPVNLQFQYECDPSKQYVSTSKGFSKREVFAMAAMQGMKLRHMGVYSEGDVKRKDHLWHPQWVAEAAVHYADALLAELSKPEDGE